MTLVRLISSKAVRVAGGPGGGSLEGGDEGGVVDGVVDEGGHDAAGEHGRHAHQRLRRAGGE
jgi:hypothetical protein